MAYNKENYLKKVAEVQAIYTEKKKSGATDVFIFNNYIKDEYYISKKTFWNWLGVNVKMEQSKLPSQQLSLYGNTTNDQR